MSCPANIFGCRASRNPSEHECTHAECCGRDADQRCVHNACPCLADCACWAIEIGVAA